MPAYPNDNAAEISAALGSMPSGSAVSEVATRLLTLFTGGSIAPGTRLPPERTLAASLEVGRSAVREALAALEILGIVDVRPGSGTYLRGNASEMLPQTLSWGMMIGSPKTIELVEVRGALEIYAARLAADRITDDALEILRDCVEEMRASQNDLRAFVEADLRFHHELAKSINNTVLLDLLQSIRSLLRVWVDRAVQDDEQVLAALQEHTAVYEAIATRNSDAAASAMATHMHTAGARLAGSIDSKDKR
ncbi:FadR/GntR family transcriptional regulator [Glaciihabitans sp. dw_435]|uniref:FadR/GntR family transcriptional regulator n=1 Tax=Glaciihabitans sp. dw_435 TaxID=2720081 RepID=UPI001BD313FA|nr:FadR/GntR family transcriptional regulator [Glaciihabitans sp. dw_435]